MRIVRNLPKIPWALVLVAASLSMGLGVVLAFAGGQGDSERQGAIIGEARRSGESTIVAYVNGHAVTLADIAEGRAQVAVNLERMRGTISRIVPDEQMPIRPVGTPLAPGEVRLFVDHGAPIPESSGMRRGLEARIELIERHGVDAVVFAASVMETALFTAATAAGHAADPADITARIAQVKAALADGLIPELEGYLSAVGEEVFFSEILPGRLAEEFAIASWRQEMLAGANDPVEWHRIWRDVEQKALSDAEITLTNKPGLNATIDGALAYLNAYWDLEPSPTFP